MSAYLIVNVERVKDQEKVQEYGKLVAEHTEKHGGKLIGASGNPEVLEGNIDSTRTLIIEFPDMESLKNWYDAPEKTLTLSMPQSTCFLTTSVTASESRACSAASS